MKIEKPAAEVRQHVDLDALVAVVRQAHQAAEEAHGDFLDRCREAGENLRQSSSISSRTGASGGRG